MAGWTEADIATLEQGAAAEDKSQGVQANAPVEPDTAPPPRIKGDVHEPSPAQVHALGPPSNPATYADKAYPAGGYYQFRKQGERRGADYTGVSDAPGPAVNTDAELQPGGPATDVAPAPSGWSEGDVAQLGELTAQQENDTLTQTFRSALQGDVDKHAGVLKLARETGIPPSIAEARYEDFRSSWEGSKFNAAEWRKANPELAKVALEDPHVGRIVMKDEQLSYFTKFLNSYSDFWNRFDDAWEPIGKVLAPNRYTPEEKAARKAQFAGLKKTPQPQALVEDSKTEAVNALNPLERAYVVPIARYKETARQMEISKLYFELMQARANAKPLVNLEGHLEAPGAGADTYELEKHIIEIEQQSVPRNYGEGPIGQLATDVAEALASQVEVAKPALKGAGAGAVLGGAAGAVAGGLIAGAPGAARGAIQGAKAGARFGAKAGLAYGSFQLESGGAYAEYLRKTKDDGTPLSEEEARGAAMLYGGVAAIIELWSTEQLLKLAGPLGEKLLGGAGKEALGELLAKDVGVREIAKRVGKGGTSDAALEGAKELMSYVSKGAIAKKVAAGVVKEAGTEYAEEASQEAAQGVVGYLASSKSQGKWQTLPTLGEALAAPTLAGEKAAVGSVGIGIPASVVHITTRMMGQANALKNGEVVKQLAGLAKDSPTVAAAPAKVAQIVQEAAKRNGEELTHLYVDPHAFARLFQSENADPAEAITHLMGEQGPRLLQEAIASGKKLEVPLKDYLEKWGATPAAEALANDTSTALGTPTTNEAVAQREEFDRRAKQLAAQFEKEQEDSSRGTERTYVDALEEQLINTKKLSEDAARKAVSLHRALVRTMSEAFGIPAEKLFADFTVMVQRGENLAAKGPTAYASRLLLQQRANELTNEQRSTESFIDSNTGVLNERAFNALAAPPGRPLVGHISVEGIKYVNDNASHDRADLLYRAVAKALHEQDPTVAKVGGDFAVRVGSQAELDALLARAQAALPVQGFSLTGSIGPDFKSAGEQHVQLKQAAEKAGTRAPREAKPIGFTGEAKALQLPEEKAQAVVPEALARSVSREEMTAEKYFEERYRNQQTGAWTAEGWNALPRKRHVIAFDLKGLKKANNYYGEHIGDAMIATLSRIATLVGGEFGDFAHLHGDEYAAQFNDLDEAKRFLARLEAGVSRAPVEYYERETDTYKPLPVEFRYGIGRWSYQAADENLNERKKLEPKQRDTAGDFSAAELEQAGGAVDVVGDQRAGSEHPLGAEGRSTQAGAGEASAGQGRADRSGLAAPQEAGPGGEGGGPASGAELGGEPGAGGLGGGGLERGASGAGADTRVAQEDAALSRGVDAARGFVARMRNPERRAAAAAWVSYCLNPESTERPKSTSNALKNAIAKFGVVDPEGFSSDELGRSMERPIGGRKSFGLEPTELRARRLANLDFETQGYSLGKQRYEQPAFHGSPHRFEKFELRKIGSGEGAQAYGWGLYFAGKKAVAEYYRKALSNAELKINSDAAAAASRFARSAVQNAVASVLSRNPNAPMTAVRLAAIRELRADISLREQELAQGVNGSLGQDLLDVLADRKEALDVLTRTKPSEMVEQGGQLYAVEIPDTEDLLDYDKPIWKQSAKVREAVKKLPSAAKRYFAEKLKSPEDRNLPAWQVPTPDQRLEKMTGEALYRGLVSLAKKTRLSESKRKLSPEEDASRFLLEHGIPGLRYLDEGSRGKGEGSHNFVIWDDSRVQVKQTYYAGGEKTPRGYVEMSREGMQRIFKIALNPTADFSTFLHESGHVFLEIFGDLAERPDAPERVKADFATVLKFLGVSKREEIGTEQHEKFAPAFEAYLFEGKAPSPKLVPAFERFKLWLKQVYRSIASLDVELNPEIRGVFDRLLASDAEVEKAKTDMGFAPLFTNPEEAGMSPEEYQQYLEENLKATSTAQRQLELRMLKDRLREQEAWWKEAAAEEKQKAQDEYTQLPANRAFQYLRTGEFLIVHPEGETLEKGPSAKLDPERVAYALGRQPSEKLNGVLKKGGLDPETMADLFGYGTGREMLEAMEKLPEERQWVAERTQERMQERYPDVAQEKAKLGELASKGLHGNHTARSLIREWEALRHKAGFDPETQRYVVEGQVVDKLPPLEAIRRAARLIAEKSTVKRLDAGAALRAERAAAENAAKAAARGNWEQAAIYKQQQLLNMFLNRELSDARELRDKFLELAQELSDDKARARLGKANPIYRDGVDLVLEALQLKEPPDSRDKPLASLGEVVTQMAADGTTPLFDRDVVERLVANPADYREMTVTELREVDGTLRNIRAAARSVASAILDGKRVEKEALVSDLLLEAAQNMQSVAPHRSGDSARTTLQKVGGWFSAFDGSLLKPETMILWLGGGSGNVQSLWFRAIVKPLQDAKVREVDLLNRTAKPIIEAFEKLPKEAVNHMMDPVDGKALFPEHRLDLKPPDRRYQLLMMALNAGNAGNLQRLLDGRNITEEQLHKALDVLSKEEMDWVQSVWDAAESLRPEAFALEERDSGLAPEKVEAVPLKTRHGTYRGGYFPAKYDVVDPLGVKQVADGVAALMDTSYTRPNTAQSHLKKRADKYAAAVLLEPGAIPAHLAQVVHDIAFREAVKSVGGLILSPAIQGILKDTLGLEKSTQFLQWVKDVGQMRGMEGADRARALNALANKVRGNTVIAALGFAAKNAVEDISNLAAAIPRADIKAKHMAAALAEFIRAPFDAAAFADSKSGELRTRREQMQRELTRQVKKLTAQGVFAAKPFEWVRHHAFAFMEASDWATSTPVWMAAYRQALLEVEAGKLTDAEAVAKADLAVRQVFPSHSPLDQSGIVRNKGMMGATLMFYGFLNTTYNGLRDLGHQFVEAEGPWQKAKVGGRFLGYIVAITALSEWLRGRGREPDEDWFQWFLRKTTLGTLSSVPFGGDLANAYEGFLKGHQVDPRNNSLVTVASQLGYAVLDAGHEYLNDGDKMGRKIENLLRASGPVVGLPISNPLAAGKYVGGVLTGEREVPTPFHFISGTIYGERPPGKQPATPLRSADEP